MKSLFQVVTLCSFLLGFANCSTEIPVVEKAKPKTEYKINLGEDNNSLFPFELENEGFSVKFSPSVLGSDNSIAFFQIDKCNAENDLVNIFINFYKERDVKNSVGYSMQIEVIKPNFYMMVNKNFKEGTLSKSIQINSVLYGKSVYLRDYNGDGKLDEWTYDWSEVELVEENKDIIAGCFGWYEFGKEVLKNLEDKGF